MTAILLYILKYKPDGKKSPYFFGTTWTPDLPSIHLPSVTVDERQFSASYHVSAKTENYETDYNPDQFLASEKMISICEKLSVSYLSRPVTISLHRHKIPQKKQLLFIPTTRIRIMDESLSIFTKDTPPLSDRQDPKEDTYYERIDKLVIQSTPTEHLFYCLEIKELVCSKQFKEKFEEDDLIGIEFTPIDKNFRYDPWRDFYS